MAAHPLRPTRPLRPLRPTPPETDPCPDSPYCSFCNRFYNCNNGQGYLNLHAGVLKHLLFESILSGLYFPKTLFISSLFLNALTPDQEQVFLTALKTLNNLQLVSFCIAEAYIGSPASSFQIPLETICASLPESVTTLCIHLNINPVGYGSLMKSIPETVKTLKLDIEKSEFQGGLETFFTSGFKSIYVTGKCLTPLEGFAIIEAVERNPFITHSRISSGRALEGIEVQTKLEAVTKKNRSNARNRELTLFQLLFSQIGPLFRLY